MRLARMGDGRWNKVATHCLRGHEYTSANTWTSKRGIRHCRKCHAAKILRLYHERLKHDPQFMAKRQEYGRAKHHQRRKALMERLGGQVCRCCGETAYEFLAFDHINGGGRKDKIDSKRVREYLAMPSPEAILQVLCHNCNSAKGYYGVCPHQVRS